MVVDDTSTDAEPNARTVLGGVKGIEYPIPMDVGNPGARIFHKDYHLLMIKALGRDGNGFGVRGQRLHGLGRIGEQVQHYLLDHGAVKAALGQGFAKVGFYFDSAFSKGYCGKVDGVMNRQVDIHRYGL